MAKKYYGIEIPSGANVGTPVICPISDSTSSINITKADGATSVLSVDTSQSRIGIGCIPERSLDVNGSTYVRGSGLDVGYKVSTEEVKIQVGSGRTGSGYSYIDFIGDTTYTDYGLRLIRGNGGQNAISELIHRGTGTFTIQTSESSDMIFQTASTEKIRIYASGTYNVAISNSRSGAVGFSVTSSATDQWAAQFQGGGWGAYIKINTNVTDTNPVLRLDNSAGQVFVVQEGGTCGIGIDPNSTFKLDVGGYARASSGIMFGTDTAAANALDDYEEGTWTPSLGGDASYTSRWGTYTKIGDTVHLQFLLQVNVKGTGSSTTISGLPFTPASGRRGIGSCTYFSTLAANAYWISPTISGSTITWIAQANLDAGCEDAYGIFGNSTYVIGGITHSV
jgi:hypothetical protein